MLDLNRRLFPLQCARRNYPGAAAPLSIPWSVAEKAYGVYASLYGTGQSLERLAERGGFGVEEMDQLYPLWREEVSEVAALRAEVERLRAVLASIHDAVDDELRRLGAVPGSCVAQIEADARAALADPGPARGA